MLNQHHPDDERLSALASRDDDATADAALASHVESCATCTDLVDELGALRMSLAQLPDLRPHRPLRLLPEVIDEPTRVDRLGGWARRFFAPVLTAGAALAMVGLIGTTVPALDNLSLGASGAASATDQSGAPVDRGAAEADETAPAGVVEPGTLSGEGAAAPDASIPLRSAMDGEDGYAAAETPNDPDSERLSQETPVERSPWPMVLFAGVALMVVAGLLRWILAPRVA